MAYNLSDLQDVARVNSEQKQTRGNVSITGHAKVHIGDSYVLNKDNLESETGKKETAIHNILQFDGEDAKRNQLTISGPVEQSLEWIKQTSFMDWLRAPTPMPFWIQGKPASGKSTLMKYLSESKSTRDTINEHGTGGTWTIVYFFFDYRAGTTMANNMLGMLKYFLKQLGDKLSSVKNVIAALQSNDEEVYLDVLADTINKGNIRVCAFVDGLDEFEGDLWDLCLLLERLRSRTGMRMCLASRPEPAFEATYGRTGCPTITMQDHNAATIRTWLDYKVERFKVDNVFAHALFTSDLLDEIVTKAQGVILWARLVMDEMVKSCYGNSTNNQESLMEILASLPPDLEPLYERILNKTNARYRSEIAWLLSLIDDVAGSYDRDRRSPILLCQALNYLQVAYLGEQQLLPCDLANEVYEKRIKILLGNLVDVELNSDVSSRASEYPQIRLIHKSLSTYLERSSWIPKNVPETARHLCKKPVWQRVTTDLMERLSPNQPLNYKEVMSHSHSRDRQYYRGSDLKKMCNNKKRNEVLVSQQYRPWYPLIIYLVSQFFSLSYHTGTDADKVRFPATCNDFALLHYQTCSHCEPLQYWGWFERARIENVHQQGRTHLILDACHDNIDRLLETLDSEMAESEKQDFCDLILLRCSKSLAGKLPTVLQEFAQHGYYIEPRHICMAPALLRRERDAKVITAAAKTTPKHQIRFVHDKDCPSRARDTDFGQHWLSLNTVTNVTFLEFLDALNIDLDGSFKSEGGFYHALLNLASLTDKTLSDKALDRFMAAAYWGRIPEPDLLQHVRKLRSKVTWEPLERHGLPNRKKSPYLNMTTEVYLSFLDWVILGLRYHAKFGYWHETWCRSALIWETPVPITGSLWSMMKEMGPDNEVFQNVEVVQTVEEPEKAKKKFKLAVRSSKQKKAKE